MLCGYAGKSLLVNLSNRTVREFEFDEEVLRLFIGGYGLGAKVLYDEMEPGADALGPGNVLGFVTGPLTGSGAVFGSRYSVVCKSPVSRTWNDANAGGFFGYELKRAGYDSVFVTGISDRPVYLWIHDGSAELRDASLLWGLDTVQTLDRLRESTRENRIRAAVIGPAGERQSLLGAIVSDGHRAAARGGPGAVMGSKKLKAVAVCGSGSVAVLDSSRLRELNASVRAAIRSGPQKELLTRLGRHGTGSSTASFVVSGESPVKNWKGVGLTDFGEENANRIDTTRLDERFKAGPFACAFCPLGCGARYDVVDDTCDRWETYRPEYETIAVFGPLCMVADPNAIMRCNDICNRYGLDTISTGATVAWAMECREHGLLTEAELGGIDLHWGNSEALVEMVEAIARREGFGEILADGSAAAADKLGRGHEYLQVVRAIEVPMHDPRCTPGFARTYCFDPTPARHVKGGYGELQIGSTNPDKYNADDKAGVDLYCTLLTELVNISGLCHFVQYTGLRDIVTGLLEAVTGISANEGLTAATRVITLRQAYNIREGLRPADFLLPSRIFGRSGQQTSINYQRMGELFYSMIGWDFATGKPLLTTLKNLGGLENVIRDLYAE